MMSLRQQGQSLNIPGQMVDRAGGGQDDGLSGSECKADQIVSGNFNTRLGVGGDSHNATLAVLRRGDVEIAVNVKSESLRAAQAAEEICDRTVAVDPVDRIETGSR